MIKRDELANPNSCLNRAADSEPVFVLRAHDPVAANIVREWASEYVWRKGGFVKLTDMQRAKVREARELAAQMEAWQTVIRDPARTGRHNENCGDPSCAGCRETL